MIALMMLWMALQAGTTKLPCLAPDGKTWTWTTCAAEPMDVVAVHTKCLRYETICPEDCFCQGLQKDGRPASETCEEHKGERWGEHPSCAVYAWTCADKSRVLLTSEDGVHHCLKFEQTK